MIINRQLVKGTPVLEVVALNQANQPLPLAIFHHGGTNNKEVVVDYGIELAQRGFRVVLPDALHHGENQHQRLTEAPDYFPVLADAVQRFPALVDHFRSVTAHNFIAVGGLSLGAKMTNMLITAYPEINVAGSLMGGMALINFWQFFYETTRGQRELTAENILNFPDGKFLAAHDLSQQLESVAQRPMFFWHSKDDHWVPFRYTYYPVKELQALPAGINVEFVITDGDEHVVPKHVVQRLADFFAKAYEEHVRKERS